jgi:hypothetical protein
MIGRLRKAFEGSDITLMATLRRPDDYLVSWEGQRMRFGMSGAPLNSQKRLDSQARTVHLDYRLMLETWVKALPGATIVLRNYADVLNNGGSVKDFNAHCRVRLPTGLTVVSSSNISNPVALSEIMRQANAALPTDQAALLRDEIIRLAPTLCLPPSRDIECYGRENRAYLHQLFQPSAAYLQDLTGTPFFPDLDEMLNTKPVPMATATREALAQLRPHIAASSLGDDLKQYFATITIE